MEVLQLILMCLLSCAAGDISEKLKQGQGLSPRESAQFLGLLAPFPDGQRPNVKGGRPSGVKGGGIKGASQGRQVGAGASNPANRVPIPFRDHTGDDDENNLDRLCNDAFHSFLCKPVGPRRNRIDGRLRPGAQIPPGVFTGANSNQLELKQFPTQSGGALKPTELENDGYSYPKPSEDGYNYPKPTNNIDTLVSPGYSYPKPPYNYDKPSNQLAYPSQVSESIQKPTNDYLPPFPSTTPAPPVTFIPSTQSTFPPFPRENFGNFDTPSNQIPAQSNQQTIVLNQIEPQYSKPFQPSQPQQFSVFSTQTYTYPQTFSTETFPVITSSTGPEVNLFRYTTKPAPEYTYTQPSTVSLPFIYTYTPGAAFTTPSEAQPVASNDQGYIYPKPSNDNLVFVSNQPEPTTGSTAQPFRFPNNGYLPPVGAPVPKASNVILDSLPFSTPATFPSFPTTQRTPVFQTTQKAPVFQTTQLIPVFQTTTLRPVTFAQTSSQSTTLRPVNIITTTPRPTTFRPYTFQTTPAPTTSRPFIFQTTQSPSTLRQFIFTTKSPRPPVFNFAASNDITISQPQFQKPNNVYLPPVNQPIPAPANEVSNVLPFNPPSPFPPNIIRGTTPRPVFSTPRPTLPPTRRPPPPPPPPATTTTTTTRRPPPPPPSKEYLPQIDIRVEGSSTNLSPNFEGGSLLAAEGDAPLPNTQKPTTERTHTLEELCRDAFHSFLCKPVGPRKNRIDGRIRPGAKIPPEVMSQLLSAASSTASRKSRPNQSGGSLLSESQNPRPRVYQQINGNTAYQPTNLNPQLIARPVQSQPPLFLFAASDSSSLAKAFLKQSTRNLSTSPKYIPFSNAKLNYIQSTIKESPSTDKEAKSTPSITTVRPITIRQTTTSTVKPRQTTVRPAKIIPSSAPSSKPPFPNQSPKFGTALQSAALQGAASATDLKSVPNKPKSESGGKLLGSSTNEGYDYPKPAKPFQFPTTPKPQTTGYEYPKPTKPFTYPSTVTPSASTSAATSAGSVSAGYTYPKPRRPFTFPPTQGPRTTRPANHPTFGQRIRPTLADQQRQQQQQLQQQQQHQQQIQEDPFSQNEVFEKDNELPPASQFEILKP